MNRARMKAGSVARNAPFGTDAQPQRNIKIVGGKQIEIAVESPPNSAGSSQQGLPPLQQGPNGTPPIEVQPSYQEYNNNKQHLVSSDKQERIVVHSQTAPCDKSNSHIHNHRGRKNSFPGLHMILPPIPSPNSLSPTSQRSWNRSRSPSPSASPTRQPRRPDEAVLSLTEQLRELLSDYDPYKFQDMYKDLAEYDQRLSGYVSQPQANMVALKHQLPLSTNMMRLLFSNFGKDDNIDLVNYERLIQYLARAQLGTAEAETLLQESVNRFVNAPDLSNGTELEKQIAHYETSTKRTKSPQAHSQHQHQHHHRQKSPDLNHVVRHEPIQGTPQRVFSDRQDAKLLMLVEQQYVQGNQEPTDLQAMKTDFMERDPSGQGTVTMEKVHEVCFKHRLPMQGSLIEKLLQRCRVGDNQHSWVAFLDFLGRVKPLALNNQTLTNHDVVRPNTWPNQREGHFPGPGKKAESPGLPQEPGPPPWETRKPLGRLGVKSPTPMEREVTQYDSPSPVRMDCTSPSAHVQTAIALSDVERTELAAMAQEHRLKKEATKVKVAPKAKENDEPWFTRFKHLVLGLYNLDSTNTGYLSKEETRGLVNNYNLIYRLGLEHPHIDKCIEGCSFSQGRVSIEHLLEALTFNLR